MATQCSLTARSFSWLFLAGISLVSTIASATPPPELFAKHGVSAPSDAKELAATQRATERVTDLCLAPEGMREGPSSAENQQCERAVADLVKLGPKSAAAILDHLDDQRVPSFAREKLLDAFARTADAETMSAWVTALERLGARAKAGTDNSAPLSHVQITDVLRRIAQADPQEVAPWNEPRTAATDEAEKAAQAWRGWVDAHKGKSRAELENLAIDEAREAIKSTDTARAYLGARRLTRIKRARAEGLRALESLKKSSGLTDDQERAINEAIDEARAQMGLPAQPTEPVAPAPKKKKKGSKPKARS